MEVGVTLCGVYLDTAVRVISPVVAGTGGNICKYDLAGIPAGPHSISMTAIAVNDPVWGNQESAQSIPLAFDVQAPAAMNFQGLWWATGGTESGWGINFAHQGDVLFATWYTYDTSGKAWWLSMLANRSPPLDNTFTGAIYVDSGPPFNNFVGSGTPAAVGNGTLTFSDANNGAFAYSLDAGAGGSPVPVSGTKAIERYNLGNAPPPICAYSLATNLTLATNYQDLWWAANGTESGWGINFVHQGDTLFATWYTYDLDGTPLWLSALTQRIGPGNVFTGSLLRTSGPRFDDYRLTDLNSAQDVGSATLTFADGNSATFNYTTNGSGGLPAVSQTKPITRFPFTATGGTVCH